MTCLRSGRALLSCLAALLVGFVTFVRLTHCHAEIPLVLLVSFDGFRWDYLKIANEQGYKTPNFDRLIANGVTIDHGGLKNTFITKTFPNHFSLVTGLYEENHGIVANDFFDSDFNETFRIGAVESENRKWWDGKSAEVFRGVEPIWLTNERKGGNRASGAYFWPGSVVDDQRPTYTRCFSGKADFKIGVRTVVEWFTKPDNPINLGLLYFSEPDQTGHREGAASTKVLEIIVMLDGIVGELLMSLEKHDLMSRMNIIVTSDHGMVNTTKMIYLDQVNASLFTVYGTSPVWNIRPKPGVQVDTVYKMLKEIEFLTVYKKDEIPPEFHYKRNRRIESIVILAPEGYNLCLDKSIKGCESKGNHGYNNSLLSMHPIFIAHGPAFKRNFSASPFNNIDIYPLMCHILRLTPHPNDGNLKNVLQLLANEDGEGISLTIITFVVAVAIAAFVAGICCLAAGRSLRIHRRKNAKSLKRVAPSSSTGMAESGRGNIKPLLESEDEDFA